MTEQGASRPFRIRRTVLQWIDHMENTNGGQPNVTPERVMEFCGWDSEPITEDEIRSATKYLLEDELIKGTPTWGGPVLRPRITPKGQRMIASGRELYDDGSSSNPSYHSNVNITNSSGIAVASNSSNVEQTVNINTLNEANALADAIAQAREAIEDAEGKAHAAQVEAEIRAEAASAQPDRGRLASLAREAMQKIATAAGTALGSGVIDAALPLIGG